ncbi:MAG: virulence factor Mce family protein [Mycobacterium sp.]|uniref:virulence factor Mce family protein n=1 Tax=Mycobacterium sp. TaxID=1785 RepID=UPI00261F43E9|nr:virulence factor Mce family protein [Mycobacterium sp.]MDI3313022.1 virulence factor Mce family protein [Mycobacterium sp.]
MLSIFIKRQLILFGILTVVATVVLGWYYLRIPTLMGIGQYTLMADLPASGGLYATANVTYRGITIGKVTAVEPTETGARATMSIASRYKIPVDASANVHTVSAVGEQYLDLVSVGNPGKYFSPGQTITRGSVPSEIGPALDTAYRGLEALPKDKIAALLDETSHAVGGLGPALQRLVDATQAITRDFKTHIGDVNDIISHSGPILDSQVSSGDAIQRWARNLNSLAAQAAHTDEQVRGILTQAPPTADQVNAVFGDVRESLPATLANLAIVLDMLKRYHKGLEQYLVFLPQGAAIAQAVTAPFDKEGLASLDLALTINQPPPCLTGFLPASEWRSPADTSSQPVPTGLYCKIPQETPANVVRGSRNVPCVDVPGKRAATPRECRSDKPYIPLGTNPWYGDPNQVRNCPAPGARCDQPVDPGRVIPAPSVNNGLNPAPADRLPPGGSPPPISDPLQRPGAGTVQCNGQQPNPCVYTPSLGPTAVYSPQSGELVGPDGMKWTVENSSNTGDDGWKEMLAPVG